MRHWIVGLIAFGLAGVSACATDPTVTEVGGTRYVGRSFLPTEADGAVVVECVVGNGGSLTDCTILSENPAGMGFGEAALQASSRARVNVSGRRAAQVGSRMRWTMRFRPE